MFQNVPEALAPQHTFPNRKGCVAKNTRQGPAVPKHLERTLTNLQQSPTKIRSSRVTTVGHVGSRPCARVDGSRSAALSGGHLVSTVLERKRLQDNLQEIIQPSGVRVWILGSAASGFLGSWRLHQSGLLISQDHSRGVRVFAGLSCCQFFSVLSASCPFLEDLSHWGFRQLKTIRSSCLSRPLGFGPQA